MKIRNIPFGYKFENGEEVIHNQESKVVIDIFEMYKRGVSLLNISTILNEQKIEYMPSVYGWNKARIKRIIEDKRYLGEKGFPKIIDEELFEQSRVLKCNKNTQKEINRQALIFKLNVPVCCPICRNAMHRHCDNRNKSRMRWVCVNNLCKTVIIKADDELIGDINKLLNTLSINPEIINTKEPENEPSYIRISDSSKNTITNEQDCKQTIYKYAKDFYNDINSDFINSKRLKDIFKMQTPTKDFQKELFDRTVKRVLFDINGKVKLELINSQEIIANE